MERKRQKEEFYIDWHQVKRKIDDMEIMNKAHQEKERETWKLYCLEQWTLKQAEKDGDK